jgi:phosphoenolpyruvate carboxykinase (GTP)
MTDHVELKKWIDDCATLCQPDKIVWIDGSDAQRDALRAEACETGELIQLNQRSCPAATTTAPRSMDVARTEHLTCICTPPRTTRGRPTIG